MVPTPNRISEDLSHNLEVHLLFVVRKKTPLKYSVEISIASSSREGLFYRYFEGTLVKTRIRSHAADALVVWTGGLT